MKDAYEQLAEAKKKEAEAATRVAREVELGKLRARSELLGLDRWGRRYWRIDGADAGGDGDGDGGAGPSGGGGGEEAAAPSPLSLWVQPGCGGVGGVLGGPPPDVPAEAAGGWHRLESTEARHARARSRPISPVPGVPRARPISPELST